MNTHYLALTIDTDPDGLNTHQPDRANLVWDGLHYAMDYFHGALPDFPLTWYIRADGQLEYAYGSVRYLLDEYADFWRQAIAQGDELGWHPHLYTVPQEDNSQPQIITDSAPAVDELRRIWDDIKHIDLPLASFRMGEAWHTAETLNCVEALGFTVDSSAIPNRDDSASGHPRNWKGTPNYPYYPDRHLPRLTGDKRPLLEIPMNSWYFKAPYDEQPKLRYMNPCIHADLWQQALEYWRSTLDEREIYVWVMILHPAEAMPQSKPDLLYAHSLDVMQQNLHSFQELIHDIGGIALPSTVSQVAQQWRKSS